MIENSRIIVHAIGVTLRASVPTIIQGALGTLTVERCNYRLDRWSKSLVERVQIDLAVSGEEHNRADEVFVVMSNHQSLYDIPVVFQALKRPLRMVAKKELFRVPIWGNAMTASGFIEVDRSDRTQAVASLSRAGKVMREKRICIWIAPEGTRSPDGNLLPFKKGGFYLAKEAGLRILPVSISGTRNILSARDYRVRPGGKVFVHLGEPVDPKDFVGQRTKIFVAEVKRRIVEGMKTHELPTSLEPTATDQRL